MKFITLLIFSLITVNNVIAGGPQTMFTTRSNIANMAMIRNSDGHTFIASGTDGSGENDDIFTNDGTASGFRNPSDYRDTTHWSLTTGSLPPKADIVNYVVAIDNGVLNFAFDRVAGERNSAVGIWLLGNQNFESGHEVGDYLLSWRISPLDRYEGGYLGCWRWTRTGYPISDTYGEADMGSNKDAIDLTDVDWFGIDEYEPFEVFNGWIDLTSLNVPDGWELRRIVINSRRFKRNYFHALGDVVIIDLD